MTYLLYSSKLPGPLPLPRSQALSLFKQSKLRFYASSCSCKHCRVYVLYNPAGDIVNLRIARKGCDALPVNECAWCGPVCSGSCTRCWNLGLC